MIGSLEHTIGQKMHVGGNHKESTLLGADSEIFSNDGKLLRSTSIRTYIEDLEKLGREISGEPVAADTTSTVAQR